MKNKYILLLSVVLLSFPLRSRARLGESEQQCEMRYGSSVYFPTPMISPIRVRYHFSGWNIDVGFKNDRVFMIRYSKRIDVTDREFRLILDAEGGLKNWRRTGNRWFRGGEEWRRIDGATAVLNQNCVLLDAGTAKDPVSYSSNSRELKEEKGYPVF